MADRNTKIRGEQILDASVTEDELSTSVAGNGISGGAGTALALDLNELSAVAVDVAADLIAIEDATDNSTKKESIADIMTAVAGDGLGATSGVLEVNPGTGLEIDTDTVRIAAAAAGVGLTGGGGSALAVDLDELNTEATFDVAADFLAIVDATDSSSDKTLWSVIATAIAGTGITATAGVLSADSVSDNITESDFVKTVLAPAVGGETVLTSVSSSAAIIANGHQVYLNGLIQEEGAGNDYTVVLSTGVTTFLTALVAGDIVTQHAILDN